MLYDDVGWNLEYWHSIFQWQEIRSGDLDEDQKQEYR